MAAIDEFKKTKRLAKQIMEQYSGKLIARKIDSNAIFNYCQAIIDKMDFYIQHVDRGWYDNKPRGLDEAIKVCDFGYRNPAKNIPEHPTWRPEYSLSQFKSKFDLFLKQDSKDAETQIKGLLTTVLNDYKTDINTDVDKSKTKNFYKPYKEYALSKSQNHPKIKSMVESILGEL